VNAKTGKTMKVFIAATIAALALASAFPAAAQSSSGSGASVRLAAARDSTADRDTYTQKARDDMQEWQKKLHVFDEKIRAKATQAHNSAGDDLNKAWTRAEAASGRLETVSSEDWNSAKISFERASHRLDLAWHKIDPENK
jgi:Skp family chaperone for outer membrane proteins